MIVQTTKGVRDDTGHVCVRVCVCARAYTMHGDPLIASRKPPQRQRLAHVRSVCATDEQG